MIYEETSTLGDKSVNIFYSNSITSFTFYKAIKAKILKKFESLINWSKYVNFSDIGSKI